MLKAADVAGVELAPEWRLLPRVLASAAVPGHIWGRPWEERRGAVYSNLQPVITRTDLSVGPGRPGTQLGFKAT